MYTDPITGYGYLHGHGATDRIGGDRGGLLYIMTTTHSGGLMERIIHIAIHTV